MHTCIKHFYLHNKIIFSRMCQEPLVIFDSSFPFKYSAKSKKKKLLMFFFANFSFWLPFFSSQNFKTVIQAFVNSRLDYSELFFLLAFKSLLPPPPPQLVQNYVPRLLYSCCKFTLLINSFTAWPSLLFIKLCFHFQILLITYKIFLLSLFCFPFVLYYYASIMAAPSLFFLIFMFTFLLFSHGW